MLKKKLKLKKMLLKKKRPNKLKECQKLVISPHEHRSLKELLFEKTSFFVKLYVCEKMLADDNLNTYSY